MRAYSAAAKRGGSQGPAQSSVVRRAEATAAVTAPLARSSRVHASRTGWKRRARTKWSADGNSIAYVESGVRLVVVRVDGVMSNYTLSPELRADGYRIVDHRFSPSGLRIAATVQRVSSSITDVYVNAPGGLWQRLDY